MSGAQQRRARKEQGLPAFASATARANNSAFFVRRNVRRKRQQLDIFAAYKVARGCVDCGYNAHPAALDLDHLPGTEKLAEISRLAQLSHNTARFQQELAKCEVVCANCHRIRTWQRHQQAKAPAAR